MFSFEDKRRVIGCILSIGFALVLFYIIANTEITLFFTDPVNISEGNFDPEKHGPENVVSLTVDEVYGEYSKTVTERHYRHRRTRYVKVTYYYYYVPVIGENGETYIICVKTEKNEDLSKLNAIFEMDSAGNIPDNIDMSFDVNMEGEMKKASEGVHSLMLKEIRRLGLYENEQELQEHVLPYVFRPVEEIDSRMSAGFAIICGLVVGCAIIYYIIRSRKSKKLKAIAAKSFISEKKDCVKIGEFPVKREHLEDINRYITNNEEDKAVERLCHRFRIEEYEAREIISDWYSYYK